MTDTVIDQLTILLSRLSRGVLDPAERDLLRDHVDGLVGRVAELEEEVVDAQQNTEYLKLVVAASAEPGHAVRRVVELEADVARLSAGQCIHHVGIHNLHHTTPVAGCRWCTATREAPQHIGGRVTAEDCPGCAGTNPPYPFICPGPERPLVEGAEQADMPSLTNGSRQ